MLTASAVLSMLLATPSTSQLRVEITSPKTRLSVYEPVKITVHAEALHPVMLLPISNAAGYPAMETWIDYGDGFIRYTDVDHTAGVEDGVGGERTLAVGDRLVKTVVLVEGQVGEELAVPFPNPGRYSLRVLFRAEPERDGVSGVVLGESNALTFEVVPADGDDQRLVQEIRTRPWILRGGLDNAEYTSLLKEFPESPLLDWGKRAVAIAREHRIHNGRYPDSDDKFASMAQGSPLAQPLFKELAQQLLDAEPWGQFDEERLQLAAENMGLARDLAQANQIWMEIAERFPGSEAAEEAKSRIDTTPPSLRVAASPWALGPPSHRLEPVSVSVQISDDQDPRPRVKLISITCDDGCVPANDVGGADYGTDDRAFELRSERKGSKTGRTYTITYEARDAAGNKTTATTTLAVPHDQGKKK